MILPWCGTVDKVLHAEKVLLFSLTDFGENYLSQKFIYISIFTKTGWHANLSKLFVLPIFVHKYADFYMFMTNFGIF